MEDATKLDFDAFEFFLESGDVDAAKRLITPANAQTRDRGWGVLWHLCQYGPHDDPGLLYHFVKLGATLELDSAGKRTSPLHRAAYNGKPRLLRALLDLGTPVDILDGFENTPLRFSLRDILVECARLLLDAGAQLSLVKENGRVFITIPQQARDFVSAREHVRAASIAMLGLLRCGSRVLGSGNGIDVLRVVARCVWGARGQENWNVAVEKLDGAC